MRRRWTKEELDYLKNNFGYLDTEKIASKLNRTRQNIITKASRMKFKRVAQREYAVYFDDEFQFIGTLQECAKRLGIKETTIRNYVSPSVQGRSEGGMFIVDIGKWRIDEGEHTNAPCANSKTN